MRHHLPRLFVAVMALFGVVLLAVGGVLGRPSPPPLGGLAFAAPLTAYSAGRDGQSPSRCVLRIADRADVPVLRRVLPDRPASRAAPSRWPACRRFGTPSSCAGATTTGWLSLAAAAAALPRWVLLAVVGRRLLVGRRHLPGKLAP